MTTIEYNSIIETREFIFRRSACCSKWTRQRKTSEEYMQVGVSELESELLSLIAHERDLKSLT